MPDPVTVLGVTLVTVCAKTVGVLAYGRAKRFWERRDAAQSAEIAVLRVEKRSVGELRTQSFNTGDDLGRGEELRKSG